ncbi:VOC family protein [Sporosarcina aquimarina]|uniref:Glyoxalase n=1 Tax=Sporosarcina aquimarina TaxID=114975 RepID=A0ABU4FYX2_9BACL|nr:VOC family protein [Sporosarcina aquimarina]MDW0109924.1 glyoxalase [Sporosarcina aquimarina]
MTLNAVLKGIDHIQIAAPPGSEEKARIFYGNLLGMIEIEKPENLKSRGGCWFQCGAQEVHIGIQPEFLPAQKAHPGFTVENLSALKSLLQDADYLISEEPPIAGRDRFFTHDPFGNRIEFLEYD